MKQVTSRHRAFIRNISFILLFLSVLLMGVGCQSNSDQQAACSGPPVPNGQLTVDRTTGMPNSASITLPALTAVCLEVKTNAASGSVSLDEIKTVAKSDLKNTEQNFVRTLEQLDEVPHTLTVEVAGKPDDHYIRVQAYYASRPEPSAEISSTQEALMIGQGYMNFWSAAPDTSHWQGGSAVSALPLYSLDGVLEAFEVTLKTADGQPAGYVVLEANKHRQIMGTAWMHGEPLSAIPLEKFETEYGPIPLDATHRYLWAGMAILGLEVTFADGNVVMVKTCEDFECPGVTFESSDRGVIDFTNHHLTPEEYEEIRKEGIQEYLDLLETESASKDGLTRSEAGTQGFFSVPQNRMSGPQNALKAGECPDPDGPRISYIPGGFEALGDFYQERREWEEYNVTNPGECAYGCVPTAAAMVLRYWDRRYPYLFPGEINTMQSPGLEDAFNELRTSLRTSCSSDGQGSTLVSDLVDHLPDYINEQAADYLSVSQIDAGWEVDYQYCGNHDSIQSRKDIIYPLVDASLPPTLGYRVSDPPDHTSEACFVESESTNHRVAVYGYRERGSNTLEKDELLVHMGWKSIRDHLIPIDQYGNMLVVSLKPPCSEGVPTGDQAELCMSFSDVPSDHWGRQSAETLSCMCVMRGYGDGTFSPDGLVTHAEFLKSVLRLAFRQETAELDGQRSDVSDLGVCQSHWASAYIEFAQMKGLMLLPVLTGDEFPADEPITRKKAAWLLAEVGKYVSNDSKVAVFRNMAMDAECFTQNPVPFQEAPYTDTPLSTSDYYSSILATTSQCVFEGVKINPNNPNSPRQFLGDEFITRIGAAKTLCTARFGHQSQVCSTQHDCVSLSCN